MPSAAIMAGARIFEDVDGLREKAAKAKFHKRTPSIGEILRGRRLKENDGGTPQDPTKTSSSSPSPSHRPAGGQSPLGERHVNSPPPSLQRVPLHKDEGRPKMHKKTKSSVSLKSLIKDKERDTQQDMSRVVTGNGIGQDCKPKKSKSSTSLSTLLCRKSKKSAQSEEDSTPTHDQENLTPSSSTEMIPAPVWAQFAKQQPRDQQGRVQEAQTRIENIEAEMRLYTPRDYSEYFPTQQRNFHNVYIPPTSPPKSPPKSPQRPPLEHKTSRNSVFKEDLSDDRPPTLSRGRSRDQSASRPPSSRAAEARPGLISHGSNSSQGSDVSANRSSEILAATSKLCLSPRSEKFSVASKQKVEIQPAISQDLDSTFEKVLDSLNIAHNMRDGMRKLKPEVKAGLIKGERIGSRSSIPAVQSELNSQRSSSQSPTKKENSKPVPAVDDPKESKRSRPRSRVFTLTKRDDGSPTKKQKSEDSTRSRSKSRPKSVDMSSSRPISMRSNSISSSSVISLPAPDSATTPGDFIHYLGEVQKPELVEIGKMHKLRILLRNESVMWTEAFITRGGMDEVIQLLYRIVKVEWREEHEDALLHETLLCLKALCTTSLGLQRLTSVEKELFPTLLGMLFDEERKGPSEFGTRSIIISLLFAHLSAALRSSPKELHVRAQAILEYLKDPRPEGDKKPLGFISQMHVNRPYRVWCKEVVNVTKEVFWIFLHHLNMIPTMTENETQRNEGKSSFVSTHFPPPRSPHPAAPYVGGVEWEATQYLAMHLELLNGLIASLPTQQQRNKLRDELKQSGWEKCMGNTLRTCKEKFYTGVHEGLKIWVRAAKEDGWKIEDVSIGPAKETGGGSPLKSPSKKMADEAPQIELDIVVGVGVGVGAGGGGGDPNGGGWI